MEKSPPHLALILKYFSGFTPQQLDQFAALEALYKDWNSRINVVSRKDIDSLYEKHVLHSLSIAALTDFTPGSEVVDIGTGGGFPGIPLAIFFPEVQFHLTDSIGKKLTVVQEIAAAIGLQNITTQHTRIEAITNRKFDHALSRAVAPLADLWKWSRPLIRTHPALPGVLKESGDKVLPPGLICLKGGELTDEIMASGTKPAVINIHEIFPEDFFKEKYILYIRR